MPNAPGTRERHARQLRRRRASETFDAELVQRPHRRAAVATTLNMFGRYSLGEFLRDGPTAFGDGRRPGAGEPGRRLGVAQPEPGATASTTRCLADAAGRLPLRLVPVQGQRAAVRLRHDAGGRRGHPGAEHSTTRSPRACRRSSSAATTRPGFEFGLGPRRQPLQLPARPGREAVADRRQPHQDLGQPHASSSASTCGAPTTCACRATRIDPAS